MGESRDRNMLNDQDLITLLDIVRQTRRISPHTPNELVLLQRGNCMALKVSASLYSGKLGFMIDRHRRNNFILRRFGSIYSVLATS
jgi:hypothetical protein